MMHLSNSNTCNVAAAISMVRPLLSGCCTRDRACASGRLATLFARLSRLRIASSWRDVARRGVTWRDDTLSAMATLSWKLPRALLFAAIAALCNAPAHVKRTEHTHDTLCNVSSQAARPYAGDSVRQGKRGSDAHAALVPCRRRGTSTLTYSQNVVLR
jgi:hypothetical protein